MRLRRVSGFALDSLVLVGKLRSKRRAPAIFMFHSIDDAPPLLAGDEQVMAHPVAVFESFVRWIASRASVVPLAAVIDGMGTGKLFSKEAVAVLTFDDGFLDNYTVAYPILRQYGCTATFFVPTATVGCEGRLSEDMIREMSRGGMGIGSHGVSHTRLTRLGRETVSAELQRSKAQIEAITGQRCSAFAYPYGDLNQEVKRLVRDSGYECAVAASVALDFGDPFELPRSLMPGRWSPLAFCAALYGAQAWRKHLSHLGWY